MKWISVKEKYPESNYNHISILAFGYVGSNNKKIITIVDYYVNSNIWEIRDQDYDFHINVTHWMPLPEQPKDSE